MITKYTMSIRGSTALNALVAGTCDDSAMWAAFKLIRDRVDEFNLDDRMQLFRPDGSAVPGELTIRGVLYSGA